ncbi:hypothetical protein CO641_04420 [Lysobacteraceae bacterium NML91-0213]|nr:hypothetical protein CO641_04420 [Xanthomonadaceae bacterium NML91-0213]
MDATPRQTSVLAVLSLVFGILGWTLLPGLGAIVAVVTGHIARAEIRRAPQAMEGDGLAIAGLVLGWLGIVLGIVLVALMLMLFGGLAWLSAWA